MARSFSPSTSNYRTRTRAIHAGQPNDETTGAVSFPIYQTSTFAQSEPGVDKGYSYARTAHPTREALERCIAELEGSEFGLAYASGMAAINGVLATLSRGDHIVSTRDLYGGAWRIFTKVYAKLGVEFTFVDTTDLNAVASAFQCNTRLLWLETPSNPLLKITDIRACAALAKQAGALTVVDNTFATPYLQQPLALGADVVVHSTTKYLGGHSDLVGGFAATNDPTVAERLYFLQKSLGAIPGPFDSWLVLRGIKTLAVRMRQHCANAHVIAAFLERHPRVERVLYPGLPSHPGHAIAARQMRDFGGMISFLAESEEEAVGLVARTQVWKLAESLGGVESLIEHPARMTHASTADAPFPAPRNLVRLSVGLESAEDLVADLELALVRSAAAAGA